MSKGHLLTAWQRFSARKARMAIMNTVGTSFAKIRITSD